MAHQRMRDGARLHYHDIGRGPAVVLLHGFAMPALLWLPFVLPLAHRYRFILPDLRGFGGSHHLRLSGKPLLTQHADDLNDLLEGLGLDEILLGGLSMGACTALQYHRHYDFKRVRAYLHMDQSACVLNTPDWRWGLLGGLQDKKLADWSQLMRELEPFRRLDFDDIPADLRRRLWATLAEFFGHAFSSRGWTAFTRLAKYETLIRRVAPTANWPIYMDCLGSYLGDNYDWRPSLPKVRIPMTLLVGTGSSMYAPEGQLHIQTLVPHARAVRFEGCGHAIPFEAPMQFLRELRGFLDTHRAAAGSGSPALA